MAEDVQRRDARAAGKRAGDLLHAIAVAGKVHDLDLGREPIEQDLALGHAGIDEQDLGRGGRGLAGVLDSYRGMERIFLCLTGAVGVPLRDYNHLYLKLKNHS